MRNLKRALSLALALVMVLSMMVVGAGAVSVDDFSDSADIVNTEAVTVLATLGVITGNDDGSYAPADTISRAEMSTIICRVLNGGKDPVLGEAVTNTYTDTANHWAKNYIEYCSTLGIVSGKGDGTYDPEGDVTVAEAAKMVLVALGYNAAMEGYTGGAWQINVDAQANPLGLYDGLDYTTTSSALTRDNAAQMLYNALDCDMVKYDVVLDTTSSTVISTTQLGETGETLLEDKFDAVKVEGIVVANELANLETSGHLVDGRTRILVTNYEDQEYYGAEKNSAGYYTDTEDFTVSTGLDELGRSVSIYVKKEPTSTNAQVLGSVIVSENNVVVTNYSKDSLATIADDNGLQVMEATESNTYYDDGTLIATNYGNLGKLSISAVSGYDATDDNIRGQEKILIDNDDDGDVEYVLVNSWRFGKVTSYVSSGDGSIVINQGSAPTLSESDADDVVGFEDVAQGDYVIAAEIGNRTFVEAAETVTGTMDAYNTGATAREAADSRTEATVVTKVTVDGEDYNTSSMLGYTGGADDIKAANEYGETYLDNEAVFYLGKGGFVVAVGETDASAYRYALVLAKDNQNVTVDERVRVALSDGTVGTYTIDTDGVRNPDLGEVYRYTLSGDEIRLTAVTDTVDLATAKFEKGRTSIKDGTTTEANATASTVFFYVGETAVSDGIDRSNVDVYNGYKDAPDLGDGIQGKVYIRSENNSTKSAGAVVFYGSDSLTSADMDDSLYVTEIVRRSTDYVVVNAFVAGSAELQTINVDITSEDDLRAGNAYTYEINSDEYYELTALDRETPEDGVNGDADVNSTVGDTFVLSRTDYNGENEYVITADTLFVNDSDYLSDPIAELGEGPGEGSYVTWVTYNSDHEAILVAIKDEEATSGRTAAPSAISLKDNNGTELESGDTWKNPTASTDKLTLNVTLATGQTGKVKVTATGTGASVAPTVNDITGDNSSQARDVYTASGNEVNVALEVTLTISETGKADRDITYTITVTNEATAPTFTATSSATLSGSESPYKITDFVKGSTISLAVSDTTATSKITDAKVEGTLDKNNVNMITFNSTSAYPVYEAANDGEAGTLTLTITTSQTGKSDVVTTITFEIEAKDVVIVTGDNVSVSGAAGSQQVVNFLTAIPDGSYIKVGDDYFEVTSNSATITMPNEDAVIDTGYWAVAAPTVESSAESTGVNGVKLTKAEADKEYAKEGETVTITVTTDQGTITNSKSCKISATVSPTVTVTDATTEIGDGSITAEETYEISFEMPDEEVTSIEVTLADNI